ncbi:MAG: type II toxin-antitoxin system Phd/YefM family antitoxin [Planctomycetota bacterium]
MKTINLKEARRRLGQLVTEAEHGETVVLTRRGRTVARLVPPDRKGLKGLPDLSEFRASIKMKGSLTDELLAMRREERH